ncbi:MAG: hypothetical protein F4186_01880 [Boseongicola sp. SB0676_bin_33]|uniref:Uncharacterized protein n=1 Tax=Boseongicola sp. SB0664_bin_43 TaxID=2604844 RepID=A0A6B0XZU9_9RHOB|nr:hypothetical protein [Boseongicola sp. SB0664_bin_43]MYF88234.1 hypothetical protein [Boseongicola sp. SB0676_bin_33]MYK31844.1 hypothetical protein [Boseongicola sp. SB0670_bin_30]
MVQSLFLAAALGLWLVQNLGILGAPRLLALFLLHVRHVTTKPSKPGFLGDLVDGVRIALEDAGIRATLAHSAFASTLMSRSLEILPVIADGAFAKGGWPNRRSPMQREVQTVG